MVTNRTYERGDCETHAPNILFRAIMHPLPSCPHLRVAHLHQEKLDDVTRVLTHRSGENTPEEVSTHCGMYQNRHIVGTDSTCGVPQNFKCEKLPTNNQFKHVLPVSVTFMCMCAYVHVHGFTTPLWRTGYRRRLEVTVYLRK